MFDLFPSEALSDALQPLIFIFSALTIVSVLIGAAFIVHAIRSWRVQSATLQMQKDIAEIKEQLKNQAKPAVAPKSQTESRGYPDIA